MYGAKVAGELWDQKNSYFTLPEYEKKHRYLIEFVSANPTGPLHLGTGRGGIIGDVLGNVLAFVGHTVLKEYYINDAGQSDEIAGQVCSCPLQTSIRDSRRAP
jgi:arginyl-tRNA synthetase